MTTPVHPEKIVDFFLALHHYWFDESLGPNAFTGMRDLAAAYLNQWVETGELPPDNTQLEIYLTMKFGEWLKSSWTTEKPDANQKEIDALRAALELLIPACGFIVDRDKGTPCELPAPWVGSFGFRYCEQHHQQRVGEGRGEGWLDEAAAQAIAALKDSQ